MLDRKDIEVLQGMFAKSENMILHEIDRVREETNRRIDQLENNMELMRQEIGALRVDTDNVNPVLTNC